ncbi:MAG: hypothetical protein KDB53_18945 [Planctomycetes bacterium]|nr:hypothetical protein [Planctomycetota bacterium]
MNPVNRKLIFALILIAGRANLAQENRSAATVLQLDRVELEVGQTVHGSIEPRPESLPVSARGGAIARLALDGLAATLEAFEEGDTVFALLDAAGRHVANLPVSVKARGRALDLSYSGVTRNSRAGAPVATAVPRNAATSSASRPPTVPSYPELFGPGGPSRESVPVPVANPGLAMGPMSPRRGAVALGAGPDVRVDSLSSGSMPPRLGEPSRPGPSLAANPALTPRSSRVGTVVDPRMARPGVLSLQPRVGKAANPSVAVAPGVSRRTTPATSPRVGASIIPRQ